MDVFHYTDKEGWNAIRAQHDWCFKTNQPRSRNRPFGAYFTVIPPTTESLERLCLRRRVPVQKLEYVFAFRETTGLEQLNNGRGREKWILYSPIDYVVTRDRQAFAGPTVELTEILDAQRRRRDDRHASGENGP